MEWALLLAHNCPIPSYLFLADHLILYSKATPKQANQIHAILNEFGHYSGHRVNPQKYKIFFSPNTDVEIASSICSILGFSQVSDLGCYLGVSVIHKRVTCSSFHYIINKLKINNWSASTVSFVGRLTLVKSTLIAIPTYFMQSSLFPIKVCNDIERLIQKFLWGPGPTAPLFRQLFHGIGTLSDLIFHGTSGTGIGISSSSLSTPWHFCTFNLCFHVLPLLELIDVVERPHQMVTFLQRVPTSPLKDKWNNHNIDWLIPGCVAVPERIRCFLRLSLKDKLISNSNRYRRHLSDNPSCLICGAMGETTLHILRDCPDTKRLWESIIHRSQTLAPLKLKSFLLPIMKPFGMPPPGWIALNTDGAVSNSTSLGSAGGLLRHSLGNWLRGFSKSLGITSPVHAELWGLFEGLKLVGS
ncbi:hypothetical protein F3Y22_tig00116976pilonHSYRG00007 [Hibiscus syriacus]|uniref:RNase H type-1 domain-containing protein n=1 Tax=Hibiscus syriacus TaxID=106335 RepID=A0A6A2WI42_HIBSY|nr:hypothetical protein F3Y22_tig00116976pilonHSYRG00007 [Hibiscus syriacus]